MKQTHDKKLAESLSPITEKLDEVNKTTQESVSPITKQLAKLDKKSEVIDGNTQTPAIEITNISRSLLDTLAFMKRSKNFFKLTEDSGKVYWNGEYIEPLGDNRIRIKNREYDISPDLQTYFTNTKLTTQFLDNFEKETAFETLKDVGFYDNIPKKGFKAARMKDALYNLPTEIDKVRNPPVPAIENESDNLQGEGVKIIIPSNIIDIYTRLEVLLGLKLSGHTDTLPEASNLIDELYKRGEVQNKQQYRNALNRFTTK